MRIKYHNDYSKYKSIITNAAIFSTIGGALGNTHGSCLPLAYKIV